MAKNETLLRSLDANTKMVGESDKGIYSADGGLGNKARKVLVTFCQDAEAIDRVRKSYAGVVKAISALPETEQRAVCLCAGSHFELESLITKAKTSQRPWEPRTSKRDEVRIGTIESQYGAEAAKQFSEMLRFAKLATVGALGKNKDEGKSKARKK